MESHLRVSASLKGQAAEKGFAEDKEGLLFYVRSSILEKEPSAWLSKAASLNMLDIILNVF